MSRADIGIGLLLAVAYLILVWQSTFFPYGSEFAPGPGFLPLWLALVGTLLSLLIAFNAWRSRRQPAFSPDLGDRSGLVRVAAAVLGLLAMMQLIPLLGLVLAVLVYLVFLTLVVQRLRWPVALGTSLGTVLFIIAVFQRFLGVPFPEGPLGF